MDQVLGISYLSKVTIVILLKPFLPPRLCSFSVPSITAMPLEPESSEAAIIATLM